MPNCTTIYCLVGATLSGMCMCEGVCMCVCVECMSCFCCRCCCCVFGICCATTTTLFMAKIVNELKKWYVSAKQMKWFLFYFFLLYMYIKLHSVRCLVSMCGHPPVSACHSASFHCRDCYAVAGLPRRLTVAVISLCTLGKFFFFRCLQPEPTGFLSSLHLAL